MAYTIAVMNKIASHGHVVHVIHWGGKSENFNKTNIHENICLYSRKNFSSDELSSKVLAIEPDLVVVSGWMDKAYLHVSRRCREKYVPVLCAMDTRWHGNLRQWIFRVICMLGWRRRHYSHAWVPGIFQYEYARKMGFKARDILFDLYSCDTDIFKIDSISPKKNRKNCFVYAGRISEEKNINFLISAWNSLGESTGDWELLVIGGSGEAVRRPKSPTIKYIDACTPLELSQYMIGSKSFILPSLCEPWGVVIHEAASSGMVLLTSNNAGASSSLLINGHNGYVFDPSNSDSLKECLLKIMKTPEIQLSSMGLRSELLSRRISPSTSAANLLSALL